MKIREAKLDDKKQIAILFSDENDYHYNLQPDVFNILSEDEILPKDWFENILTNDSQNLFVAEIDNQLVGLVFISIHQINDDPLFKPKKWINIDELTVLKNYRGKGIGTQLLSFVDNYAKEIKAESIRLVVWENNEKAIRFYESNSYEIKKHIMWKDC